MRCPLWILLAAIVPAVCCGCGSKRETVTTEPGTGEHIKDDENQRPTIPTPVATPRSGVGSSFDSFLVAYDDRFVIDIFDLQGKRTGSLDLGKSPLLEGLSGGITALAEHNGRFLAFVDPGNGGERILSVGRDGSVEPWHTYSAGTDDLSCRALVTVTPQVGTTRIFAARESGIDRFEPQGKEGRLIPNPNGGPFIPAQLGGSVECPGTTIGTMAKMTTMTDQGILALGRPREQTDGPAGTVLNAIRSLLGGSAGNPLCASSFDYGTRGKFTDATFEPVDAVQSENDVLHVLYESARGARLVRYLLTDDAFTLAEDGLVSEDVGDLGTAPTAMTLESSRTMLVANGTALVRLDLSSGRKIGSWDIDAAHITRIIGVDLNKVVR